jgi:hypothetical protein
MSPSNGLVVNLHHKIPYDEYIGRKSIWGNPFSHMDGTLAEFKVATREESISCHKEWIKTQYHLLLKLRTLKGKKLGCFCFPALCHGNTLVEMANNYEYWEAYARERMAG